ncbi:cation/H(+) antiporter 15-like [Phalaenopsis equestris]|uniref:cation/H(+) antiporter 15-like n=1 Tax=Phalaenopsis equestris TaxID=78828 RepID=UPI0009E18FFC|nr:cation/H(+) antiporter 15-like [Phalaenopsis equestris]
MDQKAGFFSDLKGGKNSSVLCFRATMSTSAGVWLDEHPLEFSFPLHLAQLSIIILSCHLVHFLLRRIGLPKVISHTIAGILLGPSLLSRNHLFQEIIFPLRSWVHLEVVSQLAFVLFIFVIGVKTDLGLIRRSGREALGVAITSTVFPFITIIVAALAHSGIVNDTSYGSIVINIARRWSLTSNTVVACLLDEFNLLTTNLGRLALCASLISDSSLVMIVAIFNSIYYSNSILFTFASLFSFIGLILFIWAVARPLAVWIVRRTPVGAALDDNCFIFALLLALGGSICGELIGETLMTGPLFLGLLLPSGPPLGNAPPARPARLMSIVSEIFLPVFSPPAGLRTNLYEFSTNSAELKRTSYLIFFGVVGKFAGVIIPCLYTKMSFRESFILSLMLNCHGVVEIFHFNSWEDISLADSEVYSANMLALIIIGGTVGALLKSLYGKSLTRLAAKKHRTIQSIGQFGELRVLICVHGDDNVPPLLKLINTIHPSAISPLCVYLLHLSPLAGQSSTILSPYRKKKQRGRASFKSLSTGSTADRIVNSFLEIERQQTITGSLSILPFIGVSPYATMHDDICTLAQDKMVDLILLPFHRRVKDSTEALLMPDSVKPEVRAVNTSVLLYAPCTAAIVVDRGFAETMAHRVALFFIGGGDDREALALVNRMVENPSIELTVIRFIAAKESEMQAKEEEELMDDEAMEQFLVYNERNEKVVYREEEVREGAETVEVIRRLREECGLIVVGRGEGRVAPATYGLEMWSEFPELGVVGDVLASADIGGKAAVMVVKQPGRDMAAGVSSSTVGLVGSENHRRRR